MTNLSSEAGKNLAEEALAENPKLTRRQIKVCEKISIKRTSLLI